MKLVILLLSVILGILIYNYSLAIGYIETMKATPQEIKREYVAVNEVPIPLTYDAGELNNYCKNEWSVLKMKGELPHEEK